jgi:hypothetical protein
MAELVKKEVDASGQDVELRQLLPLVAFPGSETILGTMGSFQAPVILILIEDLHRCGSGVLR